MESASVGPCGRRIGRLLSAGEVTERLVAAWVSLVGPGRVVRREAVAAAIVLLVAFVLATAAAGMRAVG